MNRLKHQPDTPTAEQLRAVFRSELAIYRHLATRLSVVSEAQEGERRLVGPEVAGSIPVTHPTDTDTDRTP